MNLYIKIENGIPVDHPVYEENLIQVYLQVPLGWERFERVERPVPTVYQVLDGQHPEYKKIGEVWTDVWPLRDMTAEEKAAKQQAAKDKFINRKQSSNWSAWVFNEELCEFQPPIPRPKAIEGKNVFWCGAENNWKEAPSYPEDGKQYQFDFFAWAWIEKTVNQ